MEAEHRALGSGEHPAARAWRKLAHVHGAPAGVEVVQQRPQKAAIYRLVSAGPAGRNVIAKRSAAASAATEHAIYTDILPRLPIRTLRCYGAIADDDEHFGWLFVEEAEGGPYRPELPEHRILAAQWLGTMHSYAQKVRGAVSLPDRGSAFYFAVLRAAVRTTTEILNCPGVDRGQTAVLEAVRSHCERLQHQWDVIERLSHDIPRTLVHGDLGDQNARVRRGSTGSSLLVMDWEDAGWGGVAVDLAQFGGSTLEPDLAAYWSIVRTAWPQTTLAAVTRWADLGRILRLVHAVVWANSGFHLRPSREWFFATMQWYEARLREWSAA
jgi:Ser/Thr protein kinase RdoA (MazF antagonist)